MLKDEPSRNIVLPYVARDSKRKGNLTYEMEVASILCLAEAKRKKLGILGSSREKISFIFRMHYPFWVIPWENDFLLVDGLGTTSYRLTYQETPDIRLFTEDLERSRDARSIFLDVLENNAKTFSDYSTEEFSMEAVVASREFSAAIVEYLKQETFGGQGEQAVVLAPPRLGKASAREKARKAIDHWRQIHIEITGLQYAVSLLDEETDFHREKLVKEIELIHDTYGREISQIKPFVEKTVKHLEEDNHRMIEKVLAATDKKLNTAVRSKDKQEELLRKLERSKTTYEEKKGKSKRKGDKAGKSYWNSRLESYQKKISGTNRKIQTLSHSIEETKKQGEKDVNVIKNEYQALINAEEKKITDLEALRDKETARAQKEQQTLQSGSTSIIDQISQLVNAKKTYASKIEEMRMPLNLDSVALIGIPFYLSRYYTETKHRYQVFLPVVAKDPESGKRIQRAIWSFNLESKIRSLLPLRSKALEVLDPAFTDLIEQDKAFEENICKLGNENNLFGLPRLRDVMATGMEELQSEGWINQKDKETVLGAFKIDR